MLSGLDGYGNAHTEYAVSPEKADPSVAEVAEVDLDAGEVPDDGAKADEGYVYRLRDDSGVLLSEILKALELKIDFEDIQLVTMQGGGIVEDPKKGPVAVTGDLLEVSPWRTRRTTR